MAHTKESDAYSVNREFKRLESKRKRGEAVTGRQFFMNPHAKLGLQKGLQQDRSRAMTRKSR